MEKIEDGLSLGDLMKMPHGKISLKELSKKILFNSPVSLNTTPGFPKPEVIEEELFYPIAEVCKFFNIQSLDEPFIGMEEAAKILEVSAEHLTRLSRTNKIHSYSLKNLKGSRRLFRKSELLLVKQENYGSQLSVNADAINNFMAQTELKKLFIYFMETQGTGFLTGREAEIIDEYLCQNRSYEYLAKKYDLTRHRVNQIFIRGIRRVRNYITDAHQQKVANIYKENIDLKVKLEHLTVKLQAMDSKFADIKESEKIFDLYEDWINFAIKRINTTDVEGDVPVRALRAFKILDVYTFYDLFKIYYTEFKTFMKIRNVGKKTMDDVEDYIRRKSIKFNYINEAFFTHSKFELIRKQIEFKIKHSN